MRGFRNFLLRGNLLDLAVAVVVGVAFNDVVRSLISDLVTPLIAAAGGANSFAGLSFTFHHSTFRYGDFVNAVVTFLVIMGVVYYIVVMPAARLAALTERREAATERPCPECLSDIPVAARRCRFCTAVVAPVDPKQLVPEPASPLRQRLSTWRPRN
jgi:large conductance mechanosensitive channel